jgi:type VI secretion system protein ImpD/type VI secretion system protein ImpC
MLCCDYEVRHAPGPGFPSDDVAALDGLAGVAAAAFAPTAIAAAPALLGLDSWADAGPAADLSDTIRQPDRQRWRRLQERDDTRFLAVVMPRVLGRAPWALDGARPDGFCFREYTPSSTTRIWTSPVYALASVAVRAFARNGWPAEIRGAVISPTAEGGVVDELPEERFSSDPPGPIGRPPLELSLTDEQERLAIETGLFPFIGLEGLPEATFAAAPSLHRPPRMTGEAANANQRLSAQFNAMLCVSRFAHCIKLMGRDMVGSFRTAEDIQNKLQRWLTGFTNASSSASGELGARYPLRAARVEVKEKAGKPGSFGCTIQLQPHYQLDEVGAAFRLVTDLQAARAAA